MSVRCINGTGLKNGLQKYSEKLPSLRPKREMRNFEIPNDSAGNYMFKIYNRNIRTLSLTLNIFHTLF